MKIRSFLLTALAASALAVGSASAASVTVQNFSFESSWASNADPNIDWVNSALGWGNYDFAGLITPGATSGSMAAYGSGNGAVIYQVLVGNTIAEGTYTVQIDLGQRSDEPFGGFSLSLFSVNGPNGVVSLGDYTLPADPAPGTWSTLTAVVPIANAAEEIGGNLQLNLNAYGVQTLADNVRVDFVAVPEPSTWVLLALGLSVVVTLARRRTA
jgi:hypothetical protein